ncbi:MAG TPA: RluA family pseudouridine synthase [Pyrinomonadaceae bacterium]|jgi:23S rRNA pseudouridine1911/1915/1917 synthase|nr:RluA family pseudouridine synthase [Pyrinomonadaceae bacterium]
MDSETLTFKVDDTSVDSRLDTYLASQIQTWSRARLQRLIENEDVIVNGRSAKASYRLRKGDEVEVELVASPVEIFAPENIPLEIVHEDESLIVVNKPAGLVVHPAAGIHSGTLANALAFHFQNLPASAGPIRPGIVHRLDRDTSGLLVVAKTEAALENLSEQFRDRTVLKSYIALVHGRVDNSTGRIDQPLARDPANRTRMAVVRGGRSALTLYKVRKHYQRFTLLDVELKTGRTHQIRVHLMWLHHPVVGDETYGGGRDNNIQDARLRSRVRNLGRHFLHAERLAITHPITGERLQFEAPLPTDLSDLLLQLDK